MNSDSPTIASSAVSSPMGSHHFGAQRLRRLRRVIAIVTTLSWVLGPACFFPSKASAAEALTDVAPAEVLTVDAVKVAIVPPVRDTQRLQDLVHALIGQPVDRRFSAEDIESSLSKLTNTELFERIHVDTQEGPDGTTLVFHLAPYGLIKEIFFHGAFPLLEENILNVMTIAVGSPYIEKNLNRQARFIEALYRDNGFIDPQVTFKSSPDRGDGNYTLHVHLDRGPAYHLEKIALKGNEAVSTLRLNTLMRNWQPVLGFLDQRRFREKDLTRSLKLLRQFYREHGFAEVRLSVQTEKNDQTGQVLVTITIVEGPRYEAAFAGNTAFSDRALKKHLVFLQRGLRGDVRFAKSIEQIKQRYQRAGYAQTEIMVESTMAVETEIPTRRVRFVVEEGPLTRVKAVHISGHRHLSAETLRNAVETGTDGGITPKKDVFVPEVLEADLARIKGLYRQQGFIDAAVAPELEWSADQTAVKVNITVDEGPRVKVARVTINGLTALSDEQAKSRLLSTPRQPFNPEVIPKDEKALAALLTARGYPYVSVKGRFNLTTNGRGAEINYDVNEGPLVRVGEIYYTGNFRTRPSFLQQTIDVDTGDPFSLKKMLEGQRSLRDLAFLNSAAIKALGLKEKEETIALIVQVNERKPYYVEAGAGYESDRGFFINGQLGDTNLLGRGQKGRLAGEVSQVGYQFEASITEPRLFNTPVSLTTGLFGKREEAFNVDFGVDSYGAYFNLSHDKWEHFFLALNSSLARIDQYKRSSYDTASGNIDESEFEPRSSFTVKPTAVFDMRDSVIRPQKGVYSSLSVEISRAIENDLDNLVISNGDLRVFVSPLQRLTLAALGRAAHAEPYDTTTIVPQDKLFYLGGVASVRGYKENLLYFDRKGDAVGGRNSINTSMEARYVFDNNLELSLFFDTGQITDLERKSVVEGWRSSVGAGLRYLTPIGPLGILYGYKLDRAEGESPGRFHFSFGYTF